MVYRSDRESGISEDNKEAASVQRLTFIFNQFLLIADGRDVREDGARFFLFSDVKED